MDLQCETGRSGFHCDISRCQILTGAITAQHLLRALVVAAVLSKHSWVLAVGWGPELSLNSDGFLYSPLSR